MKKNTLIFILSIFSLSAFSQGFQKIYTEDSLNINSVCLDGQGGYYLFGTYFSVNTVSSHRLVNIDKNGNKKWKKDFPHLRQSNLGSMTMTRLSDESLLIYGHIAPSEEITLIKLDKRGEYLWALNVPIWRANVQVVDSSFYVYGPRRDGLAQVVTKFDLAGKIISQTPVSSPHIGSYIVEPNGITFFASFSYTITHVDFNGQIKWNFVLPQDFHGNGHVQIVKAKDSTYFANTENHLLKLDKNGKKIWIKPFPFPADGQRFIDTDDNLMFVINKNWDKKHGIFKLNKNGTLLWTREYETKDYGQLVSIFKLPNNGFMLWGQMSFLNALLIKVDSIGLVYTNTIQGKITKDLDRNCTTSSGDVVCKNCIIEADRGNGDIYRAITNEQGDYFLNVDSGNYVIKSYPLISSNNWQNCTPSVLTTLKLSKPNDTINFFLKPIVHTPTMEVNASTRQLRRCFTNTYTVKYTNLGSRKADSAYIVVMLDSLQEFESATIPLSSKNGRKYRFNLGKVESEQSGSFDVFVRIRCGDSTRLGQTLCLEAKIYPDTVITLNPTWSGANIEVTGVCRGDSIIFQAKNTGTATSALLNAYLIENDTFRIKKTIKLPINGIHTEKVLNTGKTWRMIVDQEPNHPNSSNPTAFIEHCYSTFSKPIANFATQFANDDKALHLDIDCQPIIGSFDPNDKIGYPTGYGKHQKILQNQDIEYKIRFQNTGTDTAFTVVIRDTLSDKLDISSIEFGASSHAYKATITEKRLLTVTFNNINLVDSFKNESKSHGFVNFRIRQNKDLAFGTKITNSAGIYFDFNDPIITNTTLHTISAIEIVSSISEKKEAPLNMQIKPNPITHTALFVSPLSISGSIEIYDVTGKMAIKDKFEGETYHFYRNNLPSGVYLYKVLHQNKAVSIGKFVVQ